MIKAKTASGLVVLGLTGENVTRLVAGEPILLNLADLNLPHQQVAITYGQTNDDILRALRSLGPSETAGDTCPATHPREPELRCLRAPSHNGPHSNDGRVWGYGPDGLPEPASLQTAEVKALAEALHATANDGTFWNKLKDRSAWHVRAQTLINHHGVRMVIPERQAADACPECGLADGHKMQCTTGRGYSSQPTPGFLVTPEPQAADETPTPEDSDSRPE